MAIDTKLLSKIGELRRYRRDEFIFYEGEYGSEMYMIIAGTVSLNAIINDQSCFLAEIGEGSILGEMSLLENMPRSATARAKEESILFVINNNNFDKLFKTFPDIALRITKILSSRLRQQNEELLSLKQKLGITK